MGLILAEYSPYIIGMFMGVHVCEANFFVGVAELEQKLWVFIMSVFELIVAFGVDFEAGLFG